MAESWATLATAVEPLRAEATHRAEQVSEAREGEWLSVLETREGWARVRTEDGYEGWMADWSLTSQTTGDRADLLARWWARYARPRGTLWASDHWALAPLTLTQPLFVPAEGARERGPRSDGDWVLVATASGREGWVERADLDPRPAARDPRRVLELLHQLLGTPYRWGGRSPAGFDCSGLVQFVWEREGIDLPRDSRDQAHTGDDAGDDPGTWRAGDLLFFDDPATHVGVHDGRGHLLHCQGRVRRDALDALGSLMARWSGTRRVTGRITQRPRSLWWRPPADGASPD